MNRVRSHLLRSWRWNPISAASVSLRRLRTATNFSYRSHGASSPLWQTTTSSRSASQPVVPASSILAVERCRKKHGRGHSYHHKTKSPIPLAAFFGFILGSNSGDTADNNGRSSDEHSNMSALETALHEADRLDAEFEYRLEYDLLVSHVDEQNAEVLWRLARAIVRGFELSLLGITHQQYGALMKKAKSHALRATELAPDSKDCLLWAGIASILTFSNIHQKEKAIEYARVQQQLTRAVELDPTDPLAWHWLGRWHLLAADEPAFHSFYELIMLDHPPPSTYYDALICLHQAELLSPGFRVDNLMQMARIYVRLLDYDKAYTLLWQVISAKAFTELDRTSRDYAKRYLRAYYDEDVHDEYDMPVEFYAKIATGGAHYSDHHLEETLRKKEAKIRQQQKETKKQAAG
eukprot:scpid40365/ scgid29027/ Regulator of microtubule dynamics protein 1; Protein FAM82B